MIYPAIVTVVVLCVVSFLMMYLMPQLLPFIKNIGSDIPVYTRILMSISDAFVNYWYLIFSIPVILYIALAVAANNYIGMRYFIDGLKLKIWLIGPLV